MSKFQARALTESPWVMVESSLFSSEKKKSNDGLLFVVSLNRESGWEVSHQLELFKVEMVVVCEGTTLVDKLDLLLHLTLGKGQV